MESSDCVYVHYQYNKGRQLNFSEKKYLAMFT